MAVGPAATSSSHEGFMHLVDPNRKWYNNRRCVLDLLCPRVQQDPLLTAVPSQDHRTQRMARSSVSSPQSPTIVWVLPAVPSRLITSSTNGFDGSLMNSLQSMNQWKSFFNNPQGGTLGLLNAIQVSESVAFVRL